MACPFSEDKNCQEEGGENESSETLANTKFMETNLCQNVDQSHKTVSKEDYLEREDHQLDCNPPSEKEDVYEPSENSKANQFGTINSTKKKLDGGDKNFIWARQNSSQTKEHTDQQDDSQ